MERKLVRPEPLEFLVRDFPYGPPPDAPLDQWRVRVVEHEVEDALSAVEAYRIAPPTAAPNVEEIYVPPVTLRVVNIRVYVNVGKPGIDAPNLGCDTVAPMVAGGVALHVVAGSHRERHEARRY